MARACAVTALALGLALAAAGCASAPAAPDAFAFAVMGDTPYNAREEAHFVAMIARMDEADLAFAIHVGDFKAGGNAACTDAVYFARKAQFDASRHPLILTPGDNDWTDCRRASNGSMDAPARLARLREIFFSDGYSLGRSRLATDAQAACLAPPVAGCGCAAAPENRAWTHGRVRFATLDIPGSNDGKGFDAAGDREARCRDAANFQWLEQALRSAQDAGIRALVVATQADFWAPRAPVYREYVRALAAAAVRLQKPVLFIHGDSHTYRVDWPFTSDDGTPVVNLTRLETFGSPLVGWVEVRVDPQSMQPFTFAPHLVALVPPAP